jgi:hypothetical protein
MLMSVNAAAIIHPLLITQPLAAGPMWATTMLSEDPVHGGGFGMKQRERPIVPGGGPDPDRFRLG